VTQLTLLAKQNIFWLALVLACLLPASARASIAPENCIWEISSIGYDAPLSEATDLANRTETSTSNYDTAPIHRTDGEHRSALGTCVLFGPNAEFKAAETAGGDAYSVAFQTRLAPESYPGLSRAAHFQEANEALLQAMEGDAQFAKSMEDLGVSLERTPTGLAPRMSPADWTWHHADGLGEMELVPRYQHTPGSDFWDVLHPGGQGGYSIWGK
jgi:hypothetical protein